MNIRCVLNNVATEELFATMEKGRRLSDAGKEAVDEFLVEIGDIQIRKSQQRPVPSPTTRPHRRLWHLTEVAV